MQPALTTTASEPTWPSRWRSDLTHDIRLGPDFDHINDALMWWQLVGIPYRPATVSAIEGSSFSALNREALHAKASRVAKPGMTIVEIGVGDGPTFPLSSSRLLIDLALAQQNGRYYGLDIADRSLPVRAHGDRAIFLQSDTKRPTAVAQLYNILADRQIDFLFIDGDHSINGVLADWEFTRLLAPGSIVGLHDTACHPGPYLLAQALDRSRWAVEPNVVEGENDWGIGFAWRR